MTKKELKNRVKLLEGIMEEQTRWLKTLDKKLTGAGKLWPDRSKPAERLAEQIRKEMESREVPFDPDREYCCSGTVDELRKFLDGIEGNKVKE